MKLNAAQLREYDPSPEEIAAIERKPIYIIVDNVLDTYNVGAIYRLADAVACAGVYLVGQTDEPTDEKVGHKIHKASVGTWKWTPWKHVNTIHEALEDIKSALRHPGLAQRDPGSTQSNIDSGSGAGMTESELHVIAIEQDDSSVPYTDIEYTYPVAFIIGHETDGVSKEALEAADHIAEIPMFGVNKSLNVMISLAIVMWHVVDRVGGER